ncbi:DnaJ-domain-containing protein [Sodiomyces alkalinus F11]|uniref:DnaJ-domain-containing protein n=1 Tax=Sodiomyces alkalinus (strain CBS 110278 / VKM F-3762 / F11) TaxID=1314773 RepID=A0A3N2PTU5_SODAK|nr:DnaJ-domain-containing protein [Sodiomyces alkalinus F11]ROT37929.1 DnaJ-domain-containing protein [Sodiomyces alkalinus F11]
MGAHQSSARYEQGNTPDGTPRKTCYYELLGIAQDASDSDIKKGYRKKALELHPDRNLGNIEDATRRFAEVQSAYEVLSDPHERAWYDSHREAILRGSDGRNFDHDPPEFKDVRLTTTDDILSLIRQFNVSVPFTDEPTGFYGILNETFYHLAREERAASGQDLGEVPDYPNFGLSGDDFETVVRPFYSVWAGFTTVKSFAWKDKYRLSDAPDRRVRRMMEKENRKLRDDAAREFSEAVRFLVTFARKRDPRYVGNLQSATERRETLRAAAAAQAARSRAANLEKFKDEIAVPEWVRSRDEDDGDVLGHFSETETESEVEWIECVICDKSFKSAKSFQAHEKSKKHTKAVQQLRRQMKSEGLELELDQQWAEPGDPQTRGKQDSVNTVTQEMEQEQVMVPVSEAANPRRGTRAGSNTDTADSSSSDKLLDDGCYAPRTVVQQRTELETSANTMVSQSPGKDIEYGGIGSEMEKLSLNGDWADDSNRGDQPAKVKGKAKLKREKKAARKATQEHTCNICQEVFPSKTQLFTHIRDTGYIGHKTIQGIADRKKRR